MAVAGGGDEPSGSSVAVAPEADTAASAPVVVKLGGDVLEGTALRAVAADLADLWRGGDRLIVVHGGGQQATRMSERLGLTPSGGGPQDH